MRLLKFFAAFLLTALVIFGIVLGWNWKSFTIFMENREALSEGSEWLPKTGSLKGLSEFIGQNPRHASLAATVAGTPDSTLFFNEDIPRIMGTTSNLFLLIAYSLQFEEDRIPEDEPVRWEDVEAFQLPDVNESVFDQSYKAAANRGWAEDGELPLNRALQLLAEFDNLALADYLWWRLDPEIWDELPGMLHLRDTGMPLPFSGLYLAIAPGIQQQSFDEIEQRWSDAPVSEWRNHVITLSGEFRHNPGKRREILDYLNRDRLGNTFIEERNGLSLFPKTTTSDMLDLMNRLWNDDLINEEVSRSVKHFLRWPMETQPETERNMTDYGALYDNRMGLMNGIAFGTSRYTGETTLVALFLDQLPIGFWFHASGGHMHQDFIQRLAYDPALIEQTYKVVER